MFHIHQSTASRDCDGPFYTDNVYVPQNEIFEDETKDAMDIAMEWVMPLAFHVPDHPDSPVTITITTDDDGRYVIAWGYQHDEGFSSGEYVICDLDVEIGCEFGASQRDVYAESMGY